MVFGRERWTIAKLVLLAIAITAAAEAFSQVFTWFFQPFLGQQSLTVLSATVFDTRGIDFAAWTLVAFTIGALAGMLIRRILPAVAVTLGAPTVDETPAQAFAQHGITEWWRYIPVSRFWPMQFIEAGWLLALSVLLMAATVWLVRGRAS